MSKTILWLIAIFLVGAVEIVEAQQPKKIPRIGYVSGDPKTPGLEVEGFRQGLRDLGYVEGKKHPR